MEVIWSDDAIKDYHNNIDYLLRNWSTQVALEFIEDVEIIIGLIQDHPELYPVTYKKVRKAVIRKQISLFYEEKNNSIRLIRFWNNYQDPKKLNL